MKKIFTFLFFVFFFVIFIFSSKPTYAICTTSTGAIFQTGEEFCTSDSYPGNGATVGSVVCAAPATASYRRCQAGGTFSFETCGANFCGYYSAKDVGCFSACSGSAPPPTASPPFNSPPSLFPPSCNPANGVATIDCIPPLIATLIYWLILLVGTIAVIFIIVGGIRFIVSGGDAKKLDGARKTVIFAVLGLIVVFLSFFIVNFIASATGIGCINTNRPLTFSSCR